jgi:hypothetical protein
MEILTIGDTVLWRGSWGKDEPKEAKIRNIEICKVGEKYGKATTWVLWSTVRNGNVTVDLDNGHWACGTQINPIK